MTFLPSGTEPQEKCYTFSNLGELVVLLEDTLLVDWHIPKLRTCLDLVREHSFYLMLTSLVESNPYKAIDIKVRTEGRLDEEQGTKTISGNLDFSKAADEEVSIANFMDLVLTNSRVCSIVCLSVSQVITLKLSIDSKGFVSIHNGILFAGWIGDRIRLAGLNAGGIA